MKKSECDCCGKIAVLRRGWVTGIETFACAECHGEAADEFDEDEEPPSLRTIEGPARDQLLASMARRPAIITPEECAARNACVAAEVQRVIADMRARPDYWAGTRRTPARVTDEQWDHDMARGGLWAV